MKSNLYATNELQKGVDKEWNKKSGRNDKHTNLDRKNVAKAMYDELKKSTKN